jgi:hypothetical protein
MRRPRVGSLGVAQAHPFPQAAAAEAAAARPPGQQQAQEEEGGAHGVAAVGGGVGNRGGGGACRDGVTTQGSVKRSSLPRNASVIKPFVAR